MEWLSTLKRDGGNKLPKTVTLTGRVNNKPTTMSLATLRQVAKFDSKSENFYKLVDENDYFNNLKNIVRDNIMLSELFLLE
ncbi:hypothetical protein Hanom_Chr02g00133711 [Helianthus anomalus]